MRGGWLRMSPAADLVKNGGLSMKHAGLRMNDGGLTLLSQWNSDYVAIWYADMQYAQLRALLNKYIQYIPALN